MSPVTPRKPVWPLFWSVGLICVSLFLSSCAAFRHGSKPEQATPEKAAPKPLYGWDKEAAAKAKGPVSVKIMIDEQEAHVYKGKTEIGWTTVASGIHKYPTPVGRFKVLERVEDKHSNLYGKVVVSDARMGRDEIPEGGHFEGAQMACWMRVTDDGIGMHVGPIPHPGSRASHGCIRLPREAAKLLFKTVSLGTPVTIIGDYEPPPVFDKPKAKAETKKSETPKVVPPVMIVPEEKPVVPAEKPASPAQAQ